MKSTNGRISGWDSAAALELLERLCELEARAVQHAVGAADVADLLLA